MRSALALRLFVATVIALASSLLLRSSSGAATRRAGTGTIQAHLTMHAWPAPDSGTVVFVRDARGRLLKEKSDSRGDALFQRVHAGLVRIWAPEGRSDTIHAAVNPNDTTKVLIHTRQRGHVPGIFK